MASARAAWTAKVFELLADGEWHDRETIVRAAMLFVPHGKAARFGERQRLHMLARRDRAGQPRQKGDPDAGIRSGARTIVQASILKQVHRGHLERRTMAGVDELRLTPKETTP